MERMTSEERIGVKRFNRPTTTQTPVHLAHLEVPAGLRGREVPTKRSLAKIDELGGERKRRLHIRRRHLVAAANVHIAKHCVLFVAGCEAECGGWRRRRRRRMGEDVGGGSVRYCCSSKRRVVEKGAGDAESEHASLALRPGLEKACGGGMGVRVRCTSEKTLPGILWPSRRRWVQSTPHHSPLSCR